MKNLFFLILIILTLCGSACSKRIVDQSRMKTDSTGVSKTEWSISDTSKMKTYERMIYLPWNDSRVGSIDTAVSMDASTWTPETIVNYIKSLPDNVKLQYLPVYYEKYTSGETRLSKQEKTETKTEVKKVEKEKKSETKSDIPWVVGLAFIILGIFLIIWVVPRNKFK